MKNLQLFLCFIFVAVTTANPENQLSWDLTQKVHEIDTQCEQPNAGTFFQPETNCPPRLAFLKCVFTTLGFVDATTGLLNTDVYKATMVTEQGETVAQEFWDFCFKDVNLQEPVDLLRFNQCYRTFFYEWNG